MQGSVLLIFYSVKCFCTSQPFPQYTTCFYYKDEYFTHWTRPIKKKKSKETGRHFLQAFAHWSLLDWDSTEHLILHLPRRGSFKPQIEQSEQGAIPPTPPQTIVRKCYAMAEIAFRSPSKWLSSAVLGADPNSVGVWNIGLFIFTADKETNFTVSAVGPVLN